MLRTLILVHRWLGIPLCLLLAMWFATGIVMHFVPFPTLTDAERFDGLAAIDFSVVLRSPAEAVAASGFNAARIRLAQRADGPVYLLSDKNRVVALHAADLSSAAGASKELALKIAADHARRRGMDTAHDPSVDLSTVDQWTVSGGLDRHRPLFRVALNDEPGTELYVSSATGEVVRDTLRRERAWNYAGSVAHWIYPVVLRSRPTIWNATVWTLSLLAFVAAAVGSVLGFLQLRISQGRIASSYRGWHRWHHVLGLICMVFVLTWIFSGWLSMDSGRLFSTGSTTKEEAGILEETPVWTGLPVSYQRDGSRPAKEIEWFSFGSQIYRRERNGPNAQLLFQNGPNSEVRLADGILSPSEIGTVVGHLSKDCSNPSIVRFDDLYAVSGTMPNAPVYRSECGNIWLYFDGASGVLLERLDASRRLYRWLYSGLHSFDIPFLVARPTLRTCLIVGLCGMGFLFSLTAVAIGWDRLRS